jgi:DUF917 family protein
LDYQELTAGKIEKGNKVAILSLPARKKWRTSKGLELWKDTLQRQHTRKIDAN